MLKLFRLLGVSLFAAALLAVASSSAYALTLPPAPGTPPTISGSAQQGQTVTCSQGTWLNNPTAYSFSWQRNVTTSIGTGSGYKITAADVGQPITCTVVASNSAGQATSLPSVPVVPTAAPPAGTVPVAVSPPVISGTASPGQTVTCSTGTWLNSPTGYAYSWQSGGTGIAGQTASQYVVTNGDVDHALTCTVVAGNASGSSAPAISPPVIPLAPPAGLIPIATASPAITGSAVEGETVGCSPGSWLNSPTSYSYSWQRDAVTIAGKLASQYTLAGADVGQAITCTVVAHNTSGNSLPAVSAPIIPALASVGGGGGGGGSSSSGGSGGSGGAPGHGGTPGGVRLHAPTLKSFSVAPGKVMVLVRGKRRTTKGTTFHYALDQRAGVLIELKRRTTGRVHGRSCVAATRRNAKAKRCTRWVTVKVLRVKSAKAGSGKLKFAGRIGRRILATGAYRVYAVAVSAGGWSKVRSAHFTVAAKHAAKRTPKPRKHPHPLRHG
jgi:hypothetical protein